MDDNVIVLDDFAMELAGVANSLHTTYASSAILDQAGKNAIAAPMFLLDRLLEDVTAAINSGKKVKAL
ncbi:hypothetical protein [Candidatus Allofournierella merdipullorum]|uniref:hypothetical protein n=1 Tax=Candidatus Allofournierella merdipullorum TaxID=2838595 RepID=UPI002A8C659E|nr:hypothetical protein [Candidatus Fournierella merdipullorum]